MNTFVEFSRASKLPLMCFLRHAEKDTEKSVAHDADIPLTPSGERQAVSFGEMLRCNDKKFSRILTSPLLRCVQTAELVKKGYQADLDIISSSLLGDPGAFVNETNLAGQQFEQLSVFDVVNQHLQTNKLPGFECCEVAALALLKQAIKDTHESDLSTLYVSHDSVLCLLLGTLLGRTLAEAEWIDYLSGFAIEKKSNQFILHWRHQSIDVTHRMQHLLKDASLQELSYENE